MLPIQTGFFTNALDCFIFYFISGEEVETKIVGQSNETFIKKVAVLF